MSTQISNLHLPPPAVVPRPILRGAMHAFAAALSPFALLALLLLADGPREYVGAAMFGTSLCLLYGSSASYHLAPWSQGARRIMKRVDHSMIFVLIAGTYTPFCLIVLGNGWGIPMLCVVWVLAAAGVLVKVLRPDAPRWLGVGLYIGLGWVGVIAAAPVVSALPAAAIAGVLIGGMLYSVGAVIYAMRRPDPVPRIFGYHEVFHTFVIAGTAVHFALIAAYVIH
ncbi:MAG: hemolysin III family protein [Chloroflexota bacterium]|nr:hemolysin III family protein [Chloroflexota bacterium]